MIWVDDGVRLDGWLVDVAWTSLNESGTNLEQVLFLAILHCCHLQNAFSARYVGEKLKRPFAQACVRAGF